MSAVLFTPGYFSFHQINITATLGTLNVAADVDGVKIKGDGEMHMSLSSRLLLNLNRQLQFVTYTNTLFHPSTVDTGEASDKHHLFFFFVSPARFIFKSYGGHWREEFSSHIKYPFSE